MVRDLLNFVLGMILGVVGVFMWNFSKFLYYTVFCIQVVIIFVLINFDINKRVFKKQFKKQ